MVFLFIALQSLAFPHGPGLASSQPWLESVVSTVLPWMSDVSEENKRKLENIRITDEYLPLNFTISPYVPG